MIEPEQNIALNIAKTDIRTEQKQKKERKSNIVYYSVYRTYDEMPVYIHGTAKEIEEITGISTASLHGMEHRQRTGKCRPRNYLVYRDEEG